MIGPRLAELCRQYEVPGAVLAVLHDGEVEQAAFGVCSLRTKVPVTTGTVFQIGSITKLWTATLAMQLVDEAKLDLDAPATAYVPKFGDDRITIRHLLTHVSGIADLDFGLFGRGDDAVARFAEALAGRPMLHEPGANVSYCNSGFVLLGRIIEVLRGKVWDEVVRERLFGPLQLERAVTLPEEALLHSCAVGHMEANAETPAWIIPRSAGPAGLVSCTASDVLRFVSMHLDGGGEVLETASVAEMLRPQPGPESPDGPRGLAWAIHPATRPQVIGHDGGTFGQLSFLRVVPECNVAVVLLTNGFGGALVNRDLIPALLGEYAGVEWPAAPTAPAEPVTIEPARFEGRWNWQGLIVDIAASGGGVEVRPVVNEKVPPIPMTAIDRNSFLVRVPPLAMDSVAVFPDVERPEFAHLRGRLMVRLAEQPVDAALD